MTLAEQVEALCRFNQKAGVELRLQGERRMVSAQVWKVWAIHEAVDLEWIPEYTLTHIPTGLRVTTHLSPSALAVLAARLDALGDWSSSKREELPLERAQEILKEWNQNLP
jgi:hypothetical protein